MPCFCPLEGFRGVEGAWVPSVNKSPSRVPLSVPCGRCIGCRMDRARDWGVRLQHEGSLHDASSFVTLTYCDQSLPSDYSVSVREVQLFLKRLRKKVSPQRIRFYACGEYGDENLRPHYHLLIFGFDFPDKTVWRKTASGFLTYRSEILESVWPFGHSEVGTVTRESGSYVARYCLKKVSGPPAADHYTRLHPLTGELVLVQPEFAVMSSRPGIGFGWFNRYECDAFPSGFVVVDGVKYPVPRYYRNKLRGRDPDWLGDDYYYEGAVGRRARFTDEYLANSTDERRAVRAEVLELKLKRLKRDL